MQEFLHLTINLQSYVIMWVVGYPLENSRRWRKIPTIMKIVHTDTYSTGNRQNYASNVMNTVLPWLQWAQGQSPCPVNNNAEQQGRTGFSWNHLSTVVSQCYVLLNKVGCTCYRQAEETVVTRGIVWHYKLIYRRQCERSSYNHNPQI